ncbi:MAG: DUF1003 domain-containing protein [Gemmatimonadaceae bacterium]
MSEKHSDSQDVPDELVTTSGGSPLPTGIDRRGTRRSRKTHGVFRAVKAQHSGGQTRMQVVADWLTNLASTTAFFVFHVIAFAVWLLWNSPLVTLPKFDPFPYGLLTMIVSLEAIFLSIFVLMSQSRESKIGELREELTLQVNLRIEEEVTKTLHLVAGLYTRMGHTLGNDVDLREMLQPLDPKKMEQEVTEQIEDAIPRLRFRKKRATKQ